MNRISKVFNLWVKKQWINKINREIDKYFAIKDKLKSQQGFIEMIINDYNNLYPDSKFRSRRF